jgi:hypothetical protein
MGRLVPITDDEVLRRSRGAIRRNPIAHDFFERDGQVRVEKRGFYCEELFGPWGAWDPQAFAHLELGTPLPHPFLPVELKVLPVLPAAYRVPAKEPHGYALHSLTWLYAHFYAVERRCTRLFELEAPDEIIEPEWKRQLHALALLMNNEFVDDPVLWVGKKRVASLASKLGTEDPVVLEALLFAMGLKLEA